MQEKGVQMNDKEFLEWATERFHKTQEKRAALTGEAKEIFEKLEAVDLKDCFVDTFAVIEIAKVFDNNAINSSIYIFKLGYLEGLKTGKGAVT